jgi:hypothetical protein
MNLNSRAAKSVVLLLPSNLWLWRCRSSDESSGVSVEPLHSGRDHHKAALHLNLATFTKCLHLRNAYILGERSRVSVFGYSDGFGVGEES